MPKKNSGKLSVGSKRQVLNGTAKKTSGGLKAGDLMVNKRGKVVSKRQHQHGLAMSANLRPVASSTTVRRAKPKLRARRQGGSGLSEYASRGGGIFDDIVGGIGSVVDTGMKLAPVVGHFI